ncbi:thiamine/thiamine pyrophosphate ABC transporter permease [Orbaceae bacterium ESL0721]|nr:thiamine/thiamine pyrophosphate ABC transporter permease [Orbaceae bacterium ESL0721]
MVPIKTLLPGMFAATTILLIIGVALSSLLIFAWHTGNIAIYFDAYLWHTLQITCLQAALSTLLSILAAIVMAKVLTLVDFRAKSLLLKIMSLTFFLPSLIVVTGIIAIYGQHGWLAKICHWFGLDLHISIYGLQGILLAHIFLNFPYACQLFYHTLMAVPSEQKKLASQLNFSHYIFFKIVEWPRLKRQLLPTALLIFMLCFSSFAIVLALGGGPKYTTIEVAIYQAIRDFELLQAIVLAGLQLICLFLLLVFSNKFNKNSGLNISSVPDDYKLPLSILGYVVTIFILTIGVLFILAPIVAIIVDGIYAFRWSLLTVPLGLAILYSLIIALGSAIVTLLLSLLLLWTNSRLLLKNCLRSSRNLMIVGNLVLMIPSMVLASGFFLIFFPYAEDPLFVSLLMIICNGLTALPFILRVLEIPMYDITRQYSHLAQLLKISGWRHFSIIEYRALKPLLVISFSFAFLLSLGDFGVIALFGEQSINGYSVTTLPYYLYEQIAHYQSGAVTALTLLLLSIALMIIIDRNRTHYDHTK